MYVQNLLPIGEEKTMTVDNEQNTLVDIPKRKVVCGGCWHEFVPKPVSPNDWSVTHRGKVWYADTCPMCGEKVYYHY